MTTGERFRGSGARSITRFLEEHQACDAGFKVGRDVPGSGKLQIVCKGCGAVGDYSAASAAALGSPPEEVRRRGAAESARLEVRPRPPRRRGRPWVARAAIAALVIAGAALIAIGVLAQDDEGGTPAEPEQPPAQAEPAARQAPDAARNAAAAARRAARLREKIRLQGEVFSDRFSIGVPSSWSSGGLENGGTGLFSSDGHAAVRVYYEVGGADVEELARGAARFLGNEHPGAQVQPAVRKRVGSLRGLSLTAEYPGGSERAVVLSSDGVSYLLLEQVEAEATPFRRLQANAALQSFRPL
jgi:hypothetical protein